MKKTFSVRFLAGFLAFLMMFSYMPDLSVKAANNTSDVLENIDDNTAVASDVATDEDSIEVEEVVKDNIKEKSYERLERDVRYDASRKAWTYKDVVFATFDSITGTVTYKECVVDGKPLTYVPGRLSEYTAGTPYAEGDLELFDYEEVWKVPYDVPADTIKKIVFEDGTSYATISEGAFESVTVQYYCGYDVEDKCEIWCDWTLKYGIESVDFSNCPKFTTIASTAFCECRQLKTAIFPETLQFIGTSAFFHCELEEVILPRELIKLQAWAFGNNNIKTVIINTSNASCEVGVFGETRGPFDPTAEEPEDEEDEEPDNSRNEIEKIEFSKDTKEIPAYLFSEAGFSSKTFTIPNTVTNIGNYAFAGSNIRNISVDVENSKLQIIGEGAFADCVKLYSYPLNDGIEEIGNQAFYGCSLLGTVQFPAKYIKMGTYVYSESGIDNVIVPKELETINIGTFCNCNRLEKLTIESGIKSIGNNAIAGCAINNIVVPDTVTSLGTYVFAACAYLINITLPKDLEVLPEGTFYQCFSLKNTACIEVLDKLKVIGNSAFAQCEHMKNAAFHDGLEEIGNSAFYGCVDLETVVFPESLLIIGSQAFEGCKYLQSITIPKNVTTIGSNAFVTTTTETGHHLSEVVILSNAITECGEGAFANAYIESVTFGPNVKKIPDYLFSNARFITDYVFYIPKRIESIGNAAFINTNIKEFIFAEGPDDDSTTEIKLKTIGDSAFSGCSVIKSFNIPESVTSIGASAFRGCINIKQVDIPENVTSIGEAAFAENVLVTTINYNAKNVTTSNEYIFDGCIIDTLTLGNNVETLPDNLFKGLNIKRKNSDGTYSDILINLDIPAKVKSIGYSCFEDVKNISEVNYLGDNALTSIGDNAFKGCVNMTTNKLPQSVKTIGAGAFDGCIDLSACYIPKNLTSLGARAFAKTLIEEAIIPEEIQIINEGTFEGCSKLTTVSFNGIEISSIEACAFKDCTSLVGGENHSLDLPDNLQAIKSQAFMNCKSIEEILVPSSVEYIESDAFDGCNIKIFNVLIPSKAYDFFNEKGLITKDNTKLLNTITYVLNDTEGASADEYNGVGYYRTGDAIVLKPAKRHAFKFLGWYEDEGLTQPIATTFGRTGNLTVYAKWDAIELRTITYDLGGAENDPKNPVEVNYGDVVVLKDPIYPGYTFVGWFFENGEQVPDNTLNNIYENIKVEARWEINVYNISYDLDESTNSEENPDSFTVNDFTIELKNPVKPGYDFLGWKRVYADNTLSEDYITEINDVYEHINLKAIFDQHMYTITYDMDGGVNNEENPTGVVYRGSVTLKEPTKRGYKFIEWRLVDLDSTKPIYDNTVSDIISDIKFVAIWKANEYKISYIDDGIKSENKNPYRITIDDVVELADPVRFGYEFDKWVIINGQDETEIKVLKDIDSDIILKALWKSCTYNITYIIDLEGVENSKDNPDKINVTDEVRLVPLEKEGYVFEGWFLVGKGLDGEETLTPVTVLKNIASDITLKAKFKLAIYNIEYILDGGVNNKDNPLTIGYKEEVVLKDATRDGYTFAGWCKRVIVDGNVIDTPITKLSKIDSDITLVAKWKETQYNITYILDGGTNSEKNPTTITVLDEVKLEDAKRDYSDFAGWVLVTVDADGNEKETPVTELKNVISDITLKALWRPFEYTIKFDLNGGRADSRHEEELADKKITSEDVVTLPCADSAKCVLSKKVSYALAGWSTEQYGKGEIYTCEQQVSKLCKTKDEVITLYAVWKDDYYFIQYNVNGKGAILSPQVDAKVVASLTVPRKLHSADDITRKGYIFKGWNTKKNGKGASYAPGEAVTGIGKLKKTIKLYAQWEAITYHITYETNDGILPTTAKDTFTAAKSYTLKKPKRDGYKFVGWYKTPDCRGVKVKKTAGIFEDITLYAKWEPK